MSSETALRAFALESPAAESHLAAPVRFTVPLLDNDEFASLKAKRRSEVNLTLRVLERIHALRGERTFVAAVGTMAIGYRHMRGFSAASLLRNYYVFIRSGCDWRSLVKGYKAPSQQPKEFQDFVKGLIEQNPRSIAQALSVLRDELWPAGVSIPGYGRKCQRHSPASGRWDGMWATCAATAQAERSGRCGSGALRQRTGCCRRSSGIPPACGRWR
jgi:hypothetical protein